MFVPNFKRASSAASSAFSISFNRFAASARNLASTPSDSFNASSVDSSCGDSLSVSDVDFSPVAGFGTSDKALVRLTIEDLISPNPLDASSLTALSSCCASL
jgi:hypothetical protein